MILHVMHAEKFIEPFISFVHKNNNSSRHVFFVMGNTTKYPVTTRLNVLVAKRSLAAKIVAMFRLSILMFRADKIIVHGLFRGRFILLLYLQRWLLAKCYWVIWGKDLYSCTIRNKKINLRLKEIIRKPVIRNMGYLVTYVAGDVNLAREWYGAKGKHHNCFVYPSNLYHEYTLPVVKKSKRGIVIQVGNSADPSNLHLEVMEKLSAFDVISKVYVPLSYGDTNNVQPIIGIGTKLFGKRFLPLTDFIEFKKYLELLAEVDIAFFNHKRQQAMGNIITLLGLGKKVYMRRDISSWDFFVNIGVKVYDIDEINLDRLEPHIVANNIGIIKNYFSVENLSLQLNKIFN